MHPEALQWVKECVGQLELGNESTVVDLGARDTNGTPRDMFPPRCAYIGVDMHPGFGVHIVSDAADPTLPARLPLADVVVSTELLEHAVDPAGIVANSFAMLKPGGALIVTCAGPQRGPHGQHGGASQPDEHYANIDPDALHRWLTETGYTKITVEERESPSDVRAFAWKLP